MVFAPPPCVLPHAAVIAASGRTAVYREGRRVLACRDRSRRVLVTLNRGQRLEAASVRNGFVAVGVIRLEETIIGWEHRRVIRVGLQAFIDASNRPQRK